MGKKLSDEDQATIEWLEGLREEAQTWIGKMLAAGRVFLTERHADGVGVFMPVPEDFAPVLADIERGWI